MAADLNVLCNTNEGFLETNPKGQLVAGIAKEWGTEDNGLTWTFKMRDDVKWVDQQGNEKAEQFLDKLKDMTEFLIPNYILEGKNQLVISIGCTGGKHRSVTLANALYKVLEKQENYGVRIEHRDIEKDTITKRK